MARVPHVEECSLTSPASPRLEARDLDIWRGGRRLVAGLSFALERGQKALIVGPNGSGKTSLLRIVAGLAPSSGGQVTWNAVGTYDLSPEARAGVVYCAHLDGLKKDLTVRENLTFYARLRGADEALDELLEALSLAGVADRQVRHLSAGQRRRAGLATLLAARAQLWILDEPMTNLDAAGRALVAGRIGAHLAAGGLAVIATHQPEELSDKGTFLVEL
jgi:heme exporter protein A